jgi:RHH-type proline utilization regulon transcriptional repressor/proline dehydrogenase/delta 1-pyrroline-5-carboxylate dehydrogenase
VSNTGRRRTDSSAAGVTSRLRRGSIDVMSDRELVARATSCADSLLRSSLATSTIAERRRARRLGRVLSDPWARELVFTLADEVLRAGDEVRASRRLRSLVASGLPRGLGPLDRAGLRLAAAASQVAPKVVGRVVRERVRAEARGVIVRAQDPAFSKYVARRAGEGIDCNVNLLGEAILGDHEADARLDAVCDLLRRPDVPCVSVKVSALCANLDVLAFDASVARIAERLRRLFRVAAAMRPPKLVYLDMEEYGDLQVTITAFRTALDDPKFRELSSGVALQAYLPDSFGALDELCAWVASRRRRGGAPVRLRIVKGANLAMEQVEAELSGWPQAPYVTKAEVDANYKRMLDRAFEAASRGDVCVGVASHNLFDIAWAITLRDAHGLRDLVEIEMLEGMAPAQSRAVRSVAHALLLYCPVVGDADFAAAIAYLSRRLDENAGKENFLRALFTIRPGSPAWVAEEAKFEAAVAARHSVSVAPRRCQDRRTEHRTFDPEAAFANEPDTDFSLPANRAWIGYHLARARPAELPPPCEHPDEIDAVVARAVDAGPAWAATTTAERRVLLGRAAELMAKNRGRTIAVMARETAKSVREGDTEVSEAIDTAFWAATQTHLLDDLAREGARVSPLGTVLIAAPWNFPYAIPANGVCSALAAGNSVLLKPAPEAVATAVELVDALHDAGLPRDVIQLVRCRDDDTGRHLVTHDRIDAVVLTGSYATAQMFLAWKPRLRLIAETSGKNAIVITGGADLDLALRDLVRSAFGHAGQKCSAASLAIVERSLYDDPRFLARLADSAQSLRVGDTVEVTTMMGPLVQAPTETLRRGLTELDAGERWLVQPNALDPTGRLWSPGVRLGVRPDSWFFRTECFGPVLGVMRARDLDDALALQNGTEFGLTGGLQSLDPDEIDHWTQRVEVGNAYVNRHTTGAIVQRQPFGGWKHSSVGPGAKTGGPNDILRFVQCRSAGDGDTRPKVLDEAVLRPRDLAGLRAEQNTYRYRPLGKVLVRAVTTTTTAELDVVAQAARLTQTEVELASGREPDDTLARRLASTGAERMRVLGPISDTLAAAAHRAGITVDDTAVTGIATVELPHWVREQSISRTMHRHGRMPPARRY